jgi:hypothetical protein
MNYKLGIAQHAIVPRPRRAEKYMGDQVYDSHRLSGRNTERISANVRYIF